MHYQSEIIRVRESAIILQWRRASSSIGLKELATPITLQELINLGLNGRRNAIPHQPNLCQAVVPLQHGYYGCRAPWTYLIPPQIWPVTPIHTQQSFLLLDSKVPKYWWVIPLNWQFYECHFDIRKELFVTMCHVLSYLALLPQWHLQSIHCFSVISLSL